MASHQVVRIPNNRFAVYWLDMVCGVFVTFKEAQQYARDENEEQRRHEEEAEGERLAEAAAANYYENSGYDEARAQEAYEAAKGIW